jgi:hypothetical protein
MPSQAVRNAATLALAWALLWGSLVAQAQPPAAVVYSQPPKPSGGILFSSLRDPEGSEADQWVWDGFRFARNQAITEIRWRGAYDPARLGSGGPVGAFVVAIYASAANDTQPDVAHPPLVKFESVGTASETASDVLGGVQTYNYRYVLPAPFQAMAGTKYWVQIEAFQAGSRPDWGLTAATGGDGSYFRRIPGAGPGYQAAPGDAAFSLLGPLPKGVPLYLPMILKGWRA